MLQSDSVRIEKVVNVIKMTRDAQPLAALGRMPRMTKPEVFQGSEAVAETARDKASYSGFLAGSV